MSCCGGNCGCGFGCKCGKDSTGCKMYPEMSYAEKSSSQTLVMGVAVPERTGMMEEGEKGVAGAENGGKCKCGDNCTCDPCTCDK